MNKYNPLSIIVRIYRQTLKAIPVSSILSPFYYLIEGIFPAFIVFVSAKLFDSVYSFIKGIATLQSIYTYALLLLLGYALKLVFQYVANITINAGVCQLPTTFRWWVVDLSKKKQSIF